MKLLRYFLIAVFIVIPTLGFANSGLETKRAEIEEGTDFGFMPGEYAARFNGHLNQLGLPFSLDPSINDEDVGAQAVFSSVFADTVAVTGTAKPESRLVNGLILNGTGNGTEESGQLILLMFATAIASINPSDYPDDHLSTVLNLLGDMQNDPGSTASTVIDGNTYSLSSSPYTGVMLGISPSE
ncbi:hypothetical protein [Vreelandella nanhaiensis]|uniref:Uncharacterized protein n=1 Tax=Vreelandella nanhaiensis TaxID=1258546 RepID=A0A3S0WFR2_9GAMM|nr:hypothetical protein [Halomonas nanhaiensis]RUR27715.1 hypothetical protein ELY38_18800 [Halomonas nanhaiensis]